MQIIQYINIIKSDLLAGSHGSSWTTSEGDQLPWTPATGFDEDEAAGHGTHTAGSAAGATLNTPAETVECDGDKVLGCVGGCIEADGTRSSDDLVTYDYQTSYAEDIDRICPMFACDDEVEQWCLSDDVGQTLTEHGGMAQGAKLAIFDTFTGDVGLVDYPGNGLWEPCLEAGCKLHSNSWGGDYMCEVDALDLEYDDFMYKVSCGRNVDPFTTTHYTGCTLRVYHCRLRRTLLLENIAHAGGLLFDPALYRNAGLEPARDACYDRDIRVYFWAKIFSESAGLHNPTSSEWVIIF